MGLTGDFAGLRALRRSMESLARADGSAQKTLLRGVKQQVLLVIKSEFASSTDPTGKGWAPTVGGKPALVSKKLPQAFDLDVVDGAVKGVGKSKRDLLTAHQEGHTFKARQVAEQTQYLTFSRAGKLIKKKRALNKKGEAKRGVRQIFARAHAIGQRVLAARPIIPVGTTLPKLWDAAVRAGLAIGMQWWAEKASRR